MEDYDICIIGGSIAGLTSAMYASMDHRKVILIDKKKIIGEPVKCGEVAPSHLFEQYPDLPLGEDGLANVCDKMRITIDKVYELKLRKYKAFVLNRDKLEQNIAKKAEKNGCKIITHCRFESAETNGKISSIRTSKGEIRASVFIDASGLASVLGKRLGLVNRNICRNDVAVCSQHEIEVNDVNNSVHIWYPEELNGQGYIWEFAKGENTLNFGLGVALSSGLNPTKKLLNEFLKKRYKRYKILKTINAPIPMEHPIPAVDKFNVMLIGDAGRMVNSFTGGGIYNAVYSGHYSSAVAKQYLDGEIDDLSLYSNDFRRVLYSNLKRSYKLKEEMINNSRFLKKFKRMILFTLFSHKIAPGTAERFGMRKLHGGKI